MISFIFVVLGILFVTYLGACLASGDVISVEATEYRIDQEGVTIEEFECRHMWLFKRIIYRRDPVYNVYGTTYYYSQDGQYFNTSDDRFSSIMKSLRAQAQRESGTERAWATKKVEG